MVNPRKYAVVFLTILGILFSGCGGGGETSSQAVSGDVGPDPFPAKILTWNLPSQYTDGTTLDPVTDLDRFEIYVNEDGVFSDTDNEMAAVSATDSGTGLPVTSFDLSNLASYLSPGVTYHVSIRTVTITGMKSDFSPSAAFSF